MVTPKISNISTRIELFTPFPHYKICTPQQLPHSQKKKGWGGLNNQMKQMENDKQDMGYTGQPGREEEQGGPSRRQLSSKQTQCCHIHAYTHLVTEMEHCLIFQKYGKYA